VARIHQVKGELIMADFNFVKASVNPQTADETTMVLAYEVAKVVESIWGKEKERGYGMTECADAISMCRMLCEQECWNYTGMIPETHDKIQHSIIFTMMHISMGNIIQRRHYHNRYGNYPKGNPQESMMQLIRDLYNLAHAMSWHYYDLEELGESRYKDRMNDLKTFGIQDKLKEEYRSNT